MGISPDNLSPPEGNHWKSHDIITSVFSEMGCCSNIVRFNCGTDVYSTNRDGFDLLDKALDNESDRSEILESAYWAFLIGLRGTGFEIRIRPNFIYMMICQRIWLSNSEGAKFGGDNYSRATIGCCLQK